MTVNIAVLGCGKICHRFVKGLSFCENGKLVGFGSRNLEKAKDYAQMYDVNIYGDYNDILSNAEVDAVYISTINPVHYDQVINALKAKKHVICEKPMVESEEKYKKLFEVARENDVLLMEAIKGVFLPMNIEIKKLIKEKAIGEVIFVHAGYVHNGNFAADHWVNDKQTGGCLQDLGSYPASVVNFLLDSKPEKVEKRIIYQHDVPGFAEVLVDYANGVKAELLSSFMSCGPCFLEIHGTEGYIKAENFWKGNSFEIFKGNDRNVCGEVVVMDDFKTDFYYEIEHFLNCIINHKLQSEVVNEEFLLNLLKLTDQKMY